MEREASGVCPSLITPKVFIYIHGVSKFCHVCSSTIDIATQQIRDNNFMKRICWIIIYFPSLYEACLYFDCPFRTISFVYL